MAHFSSFCLSKNFQTVISDLALFQSPVSPKKSKTLKKHFLPNRVKNKREGIAYKIPKIYIKHGYNII
jgi:hypothetical protein